MGSYILVRKFREGRQRENEKVHYIEKDGASTICGRFDEKELRSIRNLGPFIGSGILCSECSEKADEVL